MVKLTSRSNPEGEISNHDLNRKVGGSHRLPTIELAALLDHIDMSPGPGPGKGRLRIQPNVISLIRSAEQTSIQS